MEGEGMYKLCIGYWKVATRNQDKLLFTHTFHVEQFRLTKFENIGIL